MDKILLSKSADICDYNLTRRIILALGYGANREGDKLTVYSVPGSFRGLYVRDPEKQENCKRVSTIFIDEGFQPDTLRGDGTVGVNYAWAEYCGMNTILRMIINKLDADYTISPSPYIGSGSTARHYHEQYCKALDELLPGSELEQYFDWHVLPQESEVA